MYELGEHLKANIIIGSTSILRPAQFIQHLSMLNTKQFQTAVTESK
jgi:hypothetical protein